MIQKTSHIWLFVAKSILFIFVLSVYFTGQIVFYEQTLFYFWGNNILLLLYAANLYFTSRIYNTFKFGSAGVQEILLSWTMCLIITNSLQYLILSLLQFMLLPVAGFLVVLAVQFAIVAPLIYLSDKLYYFLNPAHKAIIIFGKEEKAREYREIIEKHRKKFVIKHIVPQDISTEKLLGYIEESESVFFLDVDEERREAMLEYCFLHSKRTYILPSFSGVLINTAKISWISNTPMFLPKSPEPDMGTRFVKRFMDISISLLAIILLSWLMLIIWIAVRLGDKAPAIYKQVRVTRGGKLFTLYKFRSMRPDAEDDGIPRLTSKEDMRVTPIGRFIRMTRFDELPQLFNVLRGVMSLVGPRPERPEIAKQYEEIYPNFSFRTKVKAGLTGFAQIYGRYNTAPDEKLFLDIIYIETLSIWQDLKLILLTLKVIFKSSSTEGVPNDSTTALR